MQKILRIFPILTLLGGSSAFLYLVSLPGDVQTGWLKISSFRLAALSGIVLLVSLAVFVLLKFHSEDRATKVETWIRTFRPALLLSFLAFTFSLSIWVAFLHRDLLASLSSESMYIRLVPLMLLATMVGMQAGIVLAYPYFKDENDIFLKNTVKTTLLIMAVFVFIALFISKTQIGFTFDNVGLNWGPAGTPISFAQVNLVCSIGFLIWYLFYLVGAGVNGKHSHCLLAFDIVIFIAMWGLAVYLWSAQSISPSHFSPAPSAPNYEYYPYSDAAIFDRMSHHLLFGVGFSNTLIRRPLYVGMVALFHKIGGTGYEETVHIQILLLALIPAFIY